MTLFERIGAAGIGLLATLVLVVPLLVFLAKSFKL